MLIFALVFGRLAKLPSDGVAHTSFALAGLTIWTFVSNPGRAVPSTLVLDAPRELAGAVRRPVGSKWDELS
jgi:lipopolysaccharide transport system permease protein